MTNLYGTKPNQVPTNNDLGTMAFLDMEGTDKIFVKKATVTTLKTDPDKLLQNSNNTRLISNGNLIPDQVPLNSELGSLAFQNADSVKITGGTIAASTFTTTTLVDAYQDTNRTKVTPSLYLNFANNEVLDPRITFARASTATYVGSDGLVKTAAANVPRFDHNPVTGEGFGLLIEEAKTNLLNYSEQFDNAYWTKTNATVTTNSATNLAPDGTATADLLLETTTNGIHAVSRAYSFTVGVTYTFSIFVKPSGRSIIDVETGNNTILPLRAYFDLSTETVNVISGTASIEKFPNGWYRCSCTSATGATATTSTNVNFIITSTGTTTTYAGDVTKGLFLWGAQVEASNSVSSYIPVVASTVTRAADLVELSATTTPWYTEVGGTFLLGFRINRSSSPDNSRIFDINGGSLTSRLSLYHNTSGDVTVFNNNGGVTTSSANTNFIVGNNKYALTVKDNYVRHSLNGSAVAGLTSVNVYDGITKVQFGNYPANVIQLNGHIKSVRYYPTILSDAELVEMTA